MRRLALALTLSALCAASAAPVAQGAPQADTSVVGGGNAAAASFPSTVSIKLGKGLCTGSVISPTTVLTAGHCLEKVSAPQITVRANSPSAFSGGEVIGVTSAVRHPGFSLGRKGTVNDVAILKLAFATTAPPIAMATAAEDAALTAPGATMTIAGFGRLSPNLLKDSGAGRLRSAVTYTRPNCTGPSYRRFSTVTMICAAGQPFAVASSGRKKRQIQRNTCFGDSGGPLLADTPAGPRLLGVTSYGGLYPPNFGFVACGLKGFPDVYMRVSAFQSFITPYL